MLRAECDLSKTESCVVEIPLLWLGHILPWPATRGPGSTRAGRPSPVPRVQLAVRLDDRLELIDHLGEPGTGNRVVELIVPQRGVDAVADACKAVDSVP